MREGRFHPRFLLAEVSRQVERVELVVEEHAEVPCQVVVAARKEIYGKHECKVMSNANGCVKK